MTPSIRPADKEDTSALVDLCAVLGYQVTPEDMTKRLGLIIGSPHHQVLVAVINQQVVGFIHIFLKTLLENPIAGEIGALVVDSNLQGQGVGKMLIQAAESWANGIGCQRLVVKSNVMRPSAHAFYQAIGFHISKRQIVFEKNLPSK